MIIFHATIAPDLLTRLRGMLDSSAVPNPRRLNLFDQNKK